jgi:tetratricopeptide (TPR) repeat protein
MISTSAPAEPTTTDAESSASSAAETISVAKGAHDPHLAQELGLSACAMHYEKLGDYNTALIACDEWLTVRPDYYANLLIKSRVLFHQKNYAESEKYFLNALEAGKGLNSTGVDITVTQRKLGPRLGLGRMFSGIFPRHLECNAHLLLIYAITDQERKAEDFMAQTAVNPDHLFVSIVAIIAETSTEGLLPPKYLARYVEILLSIEPNVWAGEKQRHRAHFWLLRGQALAAMGNRDEARQCLHYALTQEPYPQVEQQIRKQMAVVG